MVDSRKEPSSTARDMRLPDDEQIILSRSLNDGRTFRIVKVYYDAEEVERHFQEAGLQASVHNH